MKNRRLFPNELNTITAFDQQHYDLTFFLVLRDFNLFSSPKTNFIREQIVDVLLRKQSHVVVISTDLGLNNKQYNGSQANKTNPYVATTLREIRNPELT